MLRVPRFPSTAILALLLALPLTGCDEDNPSSPATDNGATCQLAPTSLGFGDVPVGETATATFTVTNSGTEALSGTVNASLCGEFSVLGDASYDLAAGASKEFTIEFAPATEGATTCTIQTGTDCGGLPMSGTGTEPVTLDPVVQFSFDDTEADANGGIWNVGPVQGAALTRCSHSGSGGLALDGVDDYADLEIDGNVNFFPVGDRFSFAVWIRPSNPFDFNINTIVANASDENHKDGFKFFFNSFGSTDGALFFETGNGSEGSNLRTNAGVVQPGLWQHVGVTVDRLAGTATLYHDGVAQTATGEIRTDFRTTNNLYIGSFAENVFNYHGSMDDFRFYDGVLSAQQMAEIAAEPFNGTSLDCE